MLIENQFIKVRWAGNNRKYYEAKGYIFTSYKDYIDVRAEDLPPQVARKVKVECDYCHRVFEKAWSHHLSVGEDCCNECKHTKRVQSTKHKRQENLYNKAIQVCEKKGYILLTPQEDIERNTTYVEYRCPKHGVQTMRISNLISGKGCPECARDQAAERYKINAEEVEKRIADCGGKVINAQEYKNQSTKNLRVLCPNCGKEFITSLRNFTQHGGQVCEECYSSESVGEMTVRHYLEENQIIFVQEKWFPDCRDTNPLPFDFYLPELNTIIEFDGRQHFGETDWFSYSYEETKKTRFY